MRTNTQCRYHNDKNNKGLKRFTVVDSLKLALHGREHTEFLLLVSKIKNAL